MHQDLSTYLRKKSLNLGLIKTFIISLKQVINKSGVLPCFWQIRFYFSKIDNIATSFRKYGLFKTFYV
jgi:hypothetical protein